MLNLRYNVSALCTKYQLRLVSDTIQILPKEALRANAYNPRLVEKDKYEKWEKDGLFIAEVSSSKPAFSMVLPPPNITGKLHLGHALSCTVQDVIVRRKRAMGHNVLWLPGIDHAGIATQGVVEKYLKSTQNMTRQELGHKKFNNEVWKWKEKYGNTITNQLKTLGCSLDWSKQIFTMDTKHTYAVDSAFIYLFQKGLVYRKKALVNWCNKLQSTVSDIEIDNVSIEEPTDLFLPGYNKPVKFGQLYEFAYKIHGSDKEIVVATTMPETMLGDVAIAVNPHDDRHKELHGKRAMHPFRNKTIPIIPDHFVDMKFGTGAVKITPAHSKVDYEVAKRHNLPLVQVINEEGVIINSGTFDNLKRYYCREILLDKLQELGLLKKVTPHKMTLPVCSRTGDIIDYLPKEQWFLRCSKLNKEAAQAVESGQLKILPEKYVKNWLDWTNDDREWCISRQLYWGHQIPAYKCSVDKDTVWIAARDEKTAKNIASKYLRTLPNIIKAKRDTDVLDTWFSSGIYPFASLGWPEHYYNDNYRKFFPLNLMATGHDILGFWVHRMVILGLELVDRLPFHNILLHGIICDNQGAKMSKSKGNVIDPMDVIDGISIGGLKDKSMELFNNGTLSKEELNKALAYHKSNFSNNNGIPECGVDALRFTLLSNDIKSHFVSFDVDQCHANKLFCNKIWQSLKYLQLFCDKLENVDGDIQKSDLTYFDKWILSRLADMVFKVNKSMDNYDFHLATKALRTMIYNEFCDIYLEATKPGFDDPKTKTDYAHAHTLSAVLNTSLRCLAPFMIFLTDELIPKIPDFKKNIIHNFKDNEEKLYEYPQFKDFEHWRNSDFEDQVEKLLSFIYLARQIKSIYGMPNKVKPNIYVNTTDKLLAKDIIDNTKIVKHLTKTNNILFEKGDAKMVVLAVLDKNSSISMELIGEDIEKMITTAKSKILKRIKKLEDSLQKLESRLADNSFATSSNQNIIEQEKEKLLTKKYELGKLQGLID